MECLNLHIMAAKNAGFFEDEKFLAFKMLILAVFVIWISSLNHFLTNDGKKYFWKNYALLLVVECRLHFFPRKIGSLREWY